MKIRSKAIKAAEEDEIMEEEAPVEVAPEATDLLFEAEDVAELVAEVTGEAVEVATDADEVIFTVGDTDFAVSPEGDEEVLEASTKVIGKKAVKASQGRAVKRPAKQVQASTSTRKVIRKIPAKK